jgi:membrane dipeptidase
MRLRWSDLGTIRADRAHGKNVEITGWPATALPVGHADYFLLTPDTNCCPGCLPRHPLTAIEVFAAGEIELPRGELHLSGTLQVFPDDPLSWRYQLHDARVVGGVSRRGLLAASSLVCLPMSPAMAQIPVVMPECTVDLHSHAGNLIHVYSLGGNEPFVPVADPMRQGGMAAICLAVVADSPTTQVSEGRIRPYRNPKPGELYEHGQKAFARLHRLVREQGLAIIRDAAGLRAARAERPSIIVASEGGDWTEGIAERVDEAYERWQLRHLQLTHYRPNELGDIQTEPAVNGGLTEAGAQVIRRCNRIGVVVDVAHGTFELVKKAAAVTTKPLILSHTSLSDRQNLWTRQITSDHARAIAATGGVIGVWPIISYYPTIKSYAEGFARMADVVGVNHVGIGTDQLGLLGGSAMPSYADLPKLAEVLRARFTPDETAKLLGGNYRRAFEASLS